jgi:quinolinate synthase
MKVTTLPKVLRALERMQHRITVPPDVAARARLAIERMVPSAERGGPASSPDQTPMRPGE